MIVNSTRSELTRLRRRSFAIGWLGLTGLLTVMFTTFVFVAAADGTAIPSAAPGGTFPSAAELLGPDGRVLGLSAASTILGVVALSFWAVAAAADYSTGLIRLLVQAQPRRGRLLAGKVLALVGWTAVAAALATAIVLLVSPVMAGGTELSTAGWESGTAAVARQVAAAWANTFLALVVWGLIGLVIAIVSRSSAIAISLGLGYVLVIEGLIRLVSPDAAHWLPGATLSALAGGGSSAVDYRTAVGLGLGYAVLGLVVAGVTFSRRDVTD
jgi:ABC-2 type transport system permease protein